VRLPRDVTGQQLIDALERLGYRVHRQTGSHVRLTLEADPEHHITVPYHDPIKVGTLNAILRDVAQRHRLSRDELLQRLFA